MMGIRTLCFAIAVVLFVAHLRWLILIPAIGAIIIPYIAVIFANGGREPDNQRGFLEHRPRRTALGAPADSGSGAGSSANSGTGPDDKR
jgi:Protein of unknown function (DUF3099)